MNIFTFKKPFDLTGYTLIIPSVSVGNVPQLTTDLLITTFKLENMATVWHPGLVASIGSDPFNSDNKSACTACELYASESLKLAAVQIRSTIETKLVLKFLTDLVDSIIQLRVQAVYILATGFDYELHNVANKSTFYFLTNSKENASHFAACANTNLLEKSDVSGKLFISGAGFATKLYELMDSKISTTLLAKYVSEGENTFDAKAMLLKLFEFLRVNVEKVGPVSFPVSWHCVYGGPPPLGIF